jgi:hypothetical protein
MHADVERLIEEEMAKINSRRGELAELRDARVFVMLRDAEAAGTLTGRTKGQWGTVTAAVMTAESRLGKWQETVAEAKRLLRASPPDPGRAEGLLRGQSVPLTPEETPKEDRRPPSLSYSDPRFSLRTVGDYIAADIRTAWAALKPLSADPGVLTAQKEERGLLRARLDLYRRLARQRGPDSPELDRQYARARRLIDAVPCDLRRAEEAVGEYMLLVQGDHPESGSDER